MAQKYALITGCTPGGIGHFLAIEFANRGYTVLATVRNPAKYSPAPHASITYLPLEVTSAESISSLYDEVHKITAGKLDILYNNAGRNYTMPATDLDIDQVRDLFETNVYSVMAMCKTFTPMLIAAKGTIVQTGSLAGVLPYVWASAYSASKAALHAYSNTLRVELGPFSVRVITIVTGGVKSNIASHSLPLPSDSIFQPLDDQYKLRQQLSQQVGMDTQQYAKSCVAKVLSPYWSMWRPRYAWEGTMSWIVWFVWAWLPRAVMDIYFERKYDLGRLKAFHDSLESKKKD